MATWVRRHPLAADVLLGLVLAVALTAISAWALQDEGFDAIAYPCCALSGLAFALRRSAPVATMAAVVIAITVYGAADQPGGPIYTAPVVAAFNLACYRSIGVWLPWTAVATATLVGARWLADGVSLDFAPVGLLVMVAPKLADDFVRARRLQMEALEARLEVAEHETMRRVVEERLHIAREVHDVVGHGLATITLRAGVADRVADRDPGEVREALRAIRQISRESLGELSTLLGVLRADGPQGAERAPTPTIGEIPRLVQALRDAGLDVELEHTPGDGVSEVVGAAAYRIVQEALTNVARHAGTGVHARVRVTRRHAAVEIEVCDDGRAAPAWPRPGRGFTGMRERATSLGGRFEAGATRDGFRVWASLPVVAQ